MVDTGWLTPSTVTSEDAGNVNYIAWTSPGNAVSSNNGYATATMTGGVQAQYSHWLQAVNFGAAVPVGATITQIEVENEAKSSGTLTVQHAVRTVVAGTIGASDPDSWSTGAIATSDTAYVSTFTTGVGSLSAADVNASTFGCAVQMRATTSVGVGRTASIDVLRMRITYTLPPPPPQPSRSMQMFTRRRT